MTGWRVKREGEGKGEGESEREGMDGKDEDGGRSGRSGRGLVVLGRNQRGETGGEGVLWMRAVGAGAGWW